ncbi:MAG: prenyltransferase/squalene oxidase repeat-containing protein [Gemmataceae bacterium]
MSVMTRLGRRVALVALIFALIGMSGSTWGQNKDNKDPKQGPITEEEQQVVSKAIDKGMAYLKAHQQPDGTWGKGGHKVGYAAMCGLALLECGEPLKSPHIQMAAAFVRTHITKELPFKGASELTNTYELAASILFLDALIRAGEPKAHIEGDKRLIQLMALRLIAGQKATGGWGYNCPPWNQSQLGYLYQVLDKMPKTNSPGDAPAAFQDPREKLKLPPQVSALAVMLDPEMIARVEAKDDRTDNSCTHFAILGLWVAGNHNVPMHRTMELLVKRFRTFQNQDGSWGYQFNGGRSPQMTCVGLLGMAVGYGMGLAQMGENKKPREADRLRYHQRSWCIKASESSGFTKSEPVKDPADEKALVNGFTSLTRSIGQAKNMLDQRGNNVVPMQSLYYLWALERVAVLYSLPTVGDKEWYRWAAEMLLDNQSPNGGWEIDGKYPGQSPEINTAMALLILRRSNLTTGLSEKLPFSPGDLVKEITVKSVTAPPPLPVTEPMPEPTVEQPTPPPVIVKTPPPPTPTPVVEVPPPPPEEGGKTLLTILISTVGVLLLAGAGLFVFLNKREQDGRDHDDDDDDDRPRKKRKKKS